MRVSGIALLRIIICYGFLAMASEATARISGELMVGYDSYDSQADDVKSSTSSFYHKYSLIYDKRGSLGKYGTYGFGLGYEWAAINLSGSEIARISGNDVNRGNNSSITAGHLIYSVEYQYKSRSLPLNLSFFSRDINRMDFAGSADPLAFENGNALVPTGVTNEIFNTGTNIATGLTFAFGETSSNSLASRFPNLVQLPGILVDYREDYRSNLNSASPEHNSRRFLKAAMVKDSLWLIYRKDEQKDYLSRSGGGGGGTDFEEQTFRIGTVNSNDERIWLDLTNWIKFSADGVMLKRFEPQSSARSYSEYDINLFAVAQRPNWQTRIFNTYSRKITQALQVDEELKVPVYVNGTWGADTNWQVRFEQRDNRSSNPQGQLKDISSLASVRLETFRRSAFTLTPMLTVERVDSLNGNKIALEGRVDTASTRRFSDKLDIHASYDAKYMNEETAWSNEKQTTQTVTGTVFYRVSNRLVASADQQLTFNLGNTGTTVGSIVTTEKSTSAGSSIAARASGYSGDYLKSVTTGKVAWTQSARLRANAQVSIDLLDQKGYDLDTIMNFSGGLDYSLPQFNMSANTRYSKRTVGSSMSDEIAVTGFASYAPTPNTVNSVHGTFSRANDYGTIKSYTEIRQNFTYSKPSSVFQGKLFELKEQTLLLKSNDTVVYGSLYNELRQFSLQGKYFLTRNLYAAALARYSLLSPGNVSEWMGGASLGVQYRLLQGNIEYYQGKRTGNDNRLERRFSANLKKQF
ncbi:hypothetical protein OR1_01213 [Geobacter sp. OR-1]|nr:hypothetical protein OR1_01213 [Geobacter sp. OR-1]